MVFRLSIQILRVIPSQKKTKNQPELWRSGDRHRSVHHLSVARPPKWC